MHKKIKTIMMVGLCLGLLFFSHGCGMKKEILLEYSIQESVTSETATSETTTEVDSTDCVVINGQIPTQMYVYICGQVIHPGVYQVDENTRIFTVVELAGGLTDQADETSINQAQILVDGQMIYVPSEGEVVDTSKLGNPLSHVGSQGSSVGRITTGKVNINTANLEELMTLSGIGQGKAQKILDYRQEHGSFSSPQELMNVDGIKEGTYSKIKDNITI